MTQPRPLAASACKYDGTHLTLPLGIDLGIWGLFQVCGWLNRRTLILISICIIVSGHVGMLTEKESGHCSFGKIRRCGSVGGSSYMYEDLQFTGSSTPTIGRQGTHPRDKKGLHVESKIWVSRFRFQMVSETKCAIIHVMTRDRG